MRILSMIMCAAAASVAINAAAQLENDTEGYRRIEASFAASHYDNGENQDADIEHPKGFEIGYLQGINLTSKMPLFLELGGNVTWTHSKEENNWNESGVEIEKETKNTFMNVNIPVQAAYKFAFTNSAFKILPFFGFNFKFNIIGKYKEHKEAEFMGVEQETDTKISYFDKDDMGSKDATANRFQLGLNMGVGVNINSFYVGWRFQPDMIKYIKHDDDKVSSNTNFITVGLNF